MKSAPLILAFVLALVTVAALAGDARDARASSVWGDVTCDATVAVDDAMATLVVSAGFDSPFQCIPNGDADCDGEYTPADTLRILAFVAGSPFPTPPDCLALGEQYETTPTPSPPPGVSPPPGGTRTPTATPGATVSTTPTATPAAPTPSPTVAPSPAATPKSGVEPACNTFPADNWWNDDISGLPTLANSDAIVDRIGRWEYSHPDFGTVWNNAPIGIPYVIVGAGQPKVPVSFQYASESDPGPYPIPPNVPVEGQPVGQPNSANFGGDRHVLVIDESECVLYELFNAKPVNGGASWTAGSGAIFDLNSNDLRPNGWTSADAAGLPIWAGLVRYSEVVGQGVIDHALRFTVEDTRRAYMHPATHYASDLTATNLPPMGMRFRMKASYDCSWASTEIQVVCTALKKYGMFVADNGSDWYLSGAPDPRWDDDQLGDLKDIPSDAFEVVDTGETVIIG